MSRKNVVEEKNIPMQSVEPENLPEGSEPSGSSHKKTLTGFQILSGLTFLLLTPLIQPFNHCVVPLNGVVRL